VNVEFLLFRIVFWLYLASALCYWIHLLWQQRLARTVAFGVAWAGLVIHTALLVVRSINVHHVPYTNQYEFMLVFAWGVVLVYLASARWHRVPAIGAFVLPVSVGLMMYGFTLDRVTSMLQPALRSNWLVFHVGTAIFAYGGFAVAFSASIVYLLAASRPGRGILVGRLPSADAADDLSYRAIIFALPFMTMMILSGAIWAEVAWGRYWGWDPKETWSLITWLIYLAAVHARRAYGWRGRRAAVLSIIGFLAAIFTYWGVNTFLAGLHSYATQ
jgi:cytochrome c-type biogenesis protein CcsB